MPERVAWEPRLPLTAAESFVDFPAHNDHIVLQRARLERLATPAVKRIALSVSDFGLPTYRQSEQLEGLLYAGLERTVRFGYREAQREIEAQRTVPAGVAQRPATTRGGNAEASERAPVLTEVSPLGTRTPAETVLARYVIGDAGRRSRIARSGLPGISQLVRERAKQVASQIATTASATYAEARGKDRLTTGILVANAANRMLHNSVLELVGEALNLGRTAGALESRHVPEFALRSEQLDKNTCEACDGEHGEIYRVNSNEYYEHLPPTYCYGGGRCRGLMIFE